MKTLIIYDGEGYIIQQITGSYRVPIDIPYLELEIPEGKRIISIDVTDIENPVPVYIDIPKEEIEVLKEENLNLTETIIDLDYRLSLIEMNGGV